MSKLRPLLLSIGMALTLSCGDDGGELGASSTSSSTTTTTTTTTTVGGDASSSAEATATGAGATGEGSSSSGGDGTSGTSGTTSGGEGTSGTTSGGDGSSGTTSGGVEEPIPGSKVKVMTFNIRVGTANDGENAWDKRKGLVYQVFKDQDADFIGVQEAHHFQLVEIDANIDDYKRIGISTEDGDKKGPTNAIYYRKSRFKVDDSDTFWLSDTPGQAGSQTWGNKFPRTVTWGRFIDKATAYSFYVYNTHFDHASQSSREKSAVLLGTRISKRKVKSDPYVVTGDFNAGEGNLATRYLKGNAKIDGEETLARMRDTFRVVKPDATEVGTAHGFGGGTGGNKIDYVYVAPKQEVTGAKIDHFNVNGRYPSDHFPVVGTVRFEDKD